MPTYLAFLGHHPAISQAEILATVPDSTQVTLIDTHLLLFTSEKKLDQTWLDTIGGTIVLARQVSDRPLELTDIPQVLATELERTKGKVTFSLRGVGLSPKVLATLYRTGKDYLKKLGRAVRYVGNEHKPVLPVVLHDEHLLDGKKGCELVVVRRVDGWWIGRTVAAQDVNAYARRDMEKPVRNTTVGLLPPKLAQTMLNFGVWLLTETRRLKTPPKHLTVLDPFCGTGVIPMEVLLRGWSVRASDIEAAAVRGCTKNLEWLAKQLKIKPSVISGCVSRHDACVAFSFPEAKKDKPSSIPDIVVTEGTLGEPLQKAPSLKKAETLRRQNEKIILAFLKNCRATLPRAPLVCTWPVWFAEGTTLRLEETYARLQSIGYEAVLPPVDALPPGSRHTLVYRRPDQRVGREIVLLRPIG